MTYNIHPIFVHFPIAFLLLYSLLVILPFRKWFPSVSWRPMQFIILLAGVLGAMIASSTGEIAEGLIRSNRDLVEMHSLFADISTWIYGLLLLGEILFMINPILVKKMVNSSILKMTSVGERFLTNKILVIFLSIVGVVAISVTGLLGGAIVYGTSADPFAGFVLQILGLK